MGITIFMVGNNNKHLSNETKATLSKINTDKKNSAESKKKCSKTMKRLYEENKMKNIIALSERNKNFTRRVKCIELDKEYSSLKEAAQDTNIKNPCSITECIKGKHKYAGNLNGVKLHWIFIDNGRGK